MTHQSTAYRAHSGDTDPAGQVAQLRHILDLVGQLAGRSGVGGQSGAALDESVRISSAYDRALPIVRRRFDTRIAEAASSASAGVQALLASREAGRPAEVAAAQLTQALEAALDDIGRLLAL